MNRIRLRGQCWLVREQAALGNRTRFRLEDPDSREIVEVLCPPDEFEPLPNPAPVLDRRAVAPYTIWRSLHDALIQAAPRRGAYAAFHAGRISPEPYQFAPLARLLSNPRRSVLIADDVGLGKTIEAGICLLELIARGAGNRVLLVVPPGLIPQWLDEMWEKFGLQFQSIENSAALDRAQTAASEGLQPWAYFDRVITSVEYLKRRDVYGAALAHPWDVVVVDEAHYLAESGTPANPYSTARTRLGPKLREAARSLILLTATPHNGYRHSFRSLLELVEPTDAALHGDTEAIQRRVARAMIRRLKPQIIKTAAGGTAVPAFPVREPVQRIEVAGLNDDERRIFEMVAAYCTRTVSAAEDSEEADLVSFAMQIVRKRMLSSRAALRQTVENRLDALASRRVEEPPLRSELRELEGDLPLGEATAERTANRIVRAAIARDARRRAAEKRQLKEIAKVLERVSDRPDPKIASLIADLERDVLSVANEKAIVFTEYRDTLAALKGAFSAHAALRDAFIDLTGGLSPKQRQARIARFHEPSCRILLATDAASEGLNLQRHCRRLYHVELPWNPNRLEQRNGRIDRHGQTRPPIIRYLFHSDSPEDRVLDRLVQRIVRMHDDRVSTPDILGILEGSRVEDVLGRIDSAAAGEAEGNSLMRLFDVREQEFAQQIAPLILASAAYASADLPFGNAISADPMLDDDTAFERLMVNTLRGGLKARAIEGTYRVDVPRYLQGPGVGSRYESATFRRSVAVQHTAADVEFVHRLHPLFRAVTTHALGELTLPVARNVSTTRIAVRRHPLAEKGPLALFTYLERATHAMGAVFGIAIDQSGRLQDDGIAETLLAEDAGPPGDVPWADCEGAFASKFESLQATAASAAANEVRERLEEVRSARERTALVLRDEAALYRVDRLAEIDDEERTEREGTRQQMQLFRQTNVDWRARRAAVDTHYKKRLEAIDAFVLVPDPVEPQALGVLFVFPPV